MSQDALISWKEECDPIHREMDRLLAAGWLETAEERQVRKIQFMALIERRNVAAQDCLKSDTDRARFFINQQKLSKAPEVLSNADPMFEVDTMNVEVSRESSDASLAIERSSEAPSARPLSEPETMSVNISQEASEASLATDQSPQAPPAETRSYRPSQVR